jgi:uncharacterized iron-regulated protein
MVLWLLAMAPVGAADWLDDRGSSVSEAAVIERLQRADVVLLGEIHDSPDVHARQIGLLEAVSDAPGSRPIVLAMEQLDLEHREALEALDDRSAVDARTLAEAGAFDESGWGWEHYGPLLALAAERGWPVRPINLSRAQAREVVRGGADWRLALSPDQVAVIEPLAPDLSLPAALQSELIEDLRQVHCGDMDPAFARRIARAQVARDILMADAIRSVHDAFPDAMVVAIMGNQHARRDRGAGYWLDRMTASQSLKWQSLGMLPVAPDERRSAVDLLGDAFDLRLMTDPVERPGRCEEASGD